MLSYVPEKPSYQKNHLSRMKMKQRFLDNFHQCKLLQRTLKESKTELPKTELPNGNSIPSCVSIPKN